MEKFSNNLRAIMAFKGYNTTKLSEVSGISQPQISNLRSGKHLPTGRTLQKLSTALGVEVSDFFREDLIALSGGRK